MCAGHAHRLVQPTPEHCTHRLAIFIHRDILNLYIRYTIQHNFYYGGEIPYLLNKAYKVGRVTPNNLAALETLLLA